MHRSLLFRLAIGLRKISGSPSIPSSAVAYICRLRLRKVEYLGPPSLVKLDCHVDFVAVRLPGDQANCLLSTSANTCSCCTIWWRYLYYNCLRLFLPWFFSPFSLYLMIRWILWMLSCIAIIKTIKMSLCIAACKIVFEPIVQEKVTKNITSSF